MRGTRAASGRQCAARRGAAVYGKILSIFCFMVSAVNGLTM